MVMKRRRSYGSNPWARRVKRAVNVASRFAGSYLQYRLSNQGSSGVTITKNYDVKRQYRYKRMPRYKKRRWIKFTKKVRAVIDKSIATSTQIYNSTVTTAEITTAQDYVCSWMFGKNGAFGAKENGNTDLGQLVADYAPTTNQNFKFAVSSAVLDCTLKNTGTTDLEVDVYDVVLRNDCREADFGAVHGTALTQTPSVAARPKISITTRGMTLFDMPNMIRYGGIKILKKTKLFLPSTNTATYQIRDPRTYVFNSLDIRQGGTLGSGSFIEPGKTRGLVFISKNTVGQNAGGYLSVGFTRKYALKIFEDSTFSGSS